MATAAAALFRKAHTSHAHGYAHATHSTSSTHGSSSSSSYHAMLVAKQDLRVFQGGQRERGEGEWGRKLLGLEVHKRDRLAHNLPHTLCIILSLICAYILFLSSLSCPGGGGGGGGGGNLLD